MKESEVSQQSGEESFVGIALRNPHLVIVVFIALVLLGTVSAILIPKDLLPASHSPAVQILSFYPGMPVENVDQEITFPYERYTGQAVGIESQESRSLPGVSVVRDFFHSNTELSTAMAQVGSLVMSVLRKLPPGTQPPILLPFDPMASEPLIISTISGEGKTETELQDIGRYWAINAIQSVSGAMAPTVMGGKLRQANVLLDGAKLGALNLSPLRVSEKIEAMNSFVPAGDVNLGDYDYQLRSNAMFTDIGEVNDFYLRSQNGAVVKIADVGKAEDGAAIQTNIVTVNGNREVYLPIYRQPGANSLAVVDGVRESLKQLEASFPGFKVQLVNDQTIFIRKAIEGLSIEGLIGGGLAALMILLFLGSGRATTAVLLTLPTSIIGSIAVLHALGMTLNLMTLGGLALSVGVLVDNAIVVIELIMSKRAEGLSPRRAALEGAREVAAPVLASTTATLVVFVPVFFLEGPVKILFASLSVAVVASLGISYFSAMTLVPLFSVRYLSGKVADATAGFQGAIHRAFGRATEAYGRSLRWVIKRSRAILGWSFLLHILVAGVSVYYLGFELFPRADSGGFLITLRAPTGLRVEKTADIAGRVEKRIREVILPGDLKTVISNSGVFFGYSAAFSKNAGSQDAFISVELTESRRYSSLHYVKMLRSLLKNDFPEDGFAFETGGLLSSALNRGLPSPIEVQISGAETARSFAIAQALLPKIRDVRGSVDVRIQQRFDAPILKMNLDRRKVSDYGLTPELVVKNLVSAVSNSTSYDPQVWVDPRTGIDYLLGVQFQEGSFKTREQLLDIPVTSSNQERSIPLKNFTTISEEKGPTELKHTNLKSTIDIFLDAQDRDVGGVARDIQEILDREPLPAGYHAALLGEVSEMKRSIASLGWGFLLAACLVYLILVAQFRSFAMPAIVMTNVPKGVVGVLAMLALTRTYFSIQAAIGMIFVIGVSVSHSVMLLEIILEKTKGATLLEDGIIEASKARLRPILMTSLASILGLLPMALGLGRGSEANIPLGRAVIGGQILSTLLNFYLLPCLYDQIERRRRSGATARLDEEPSLEEKRNAA